MPGHEILQDSAHAIDALAFSTKLDHLGHLIARYELVAKSYPIIADESWVHKVKNQFIKGITTKTEFILLAVMTEKRSTPVDLRNTLKAEQDRADKAGVTARIHKVVSQMLQRGCSLQKIE